MRLLLVSAALVLVGACGSETATPTADPADVVERFLVSLEAGDCQDVKDIVVTPSNVDCELVDVLSGSFAEEGVDLDEVTYASGDVEGDSASVVVTWSTGEPDDSYEVERVDGEWKVVFDSVE